MLPSMSHQHRALLALPLCIPPKRNSGGNSPWNVPPEKDQGLWSILWHGDAEVTPQVRQDPVHT